MIQFNVFHIPVEAPRTRATWHPQMRSEGNETESFMGTVPVDTL